ncbi:amino acid/amide ABC transporter membrane protein 2, HAAT family [Desulfitobacterium dichloroeliminans LMG P-21439]|uniref:Amino acid/amide ABC transporter membrane protein 2, HAAT family n=2 Tax=Desulfitobacterium dichloroeliminans TaxID=233055 RepID=L0FCR7_DESDL|nr:amino acid/amide ABC transporter membrane protein 2, HAAT family [Desulfitobacterium dichloroeliminans LMG P-21439]
MKMNRGSFPIIGSIVVLLAIVILPSLLTAYGLSLLTQVLIFGLFAMSLDLLVGYTGLVSFNHASFFGVGAYTAAILVTRGVENFWLTLLGGVFISLLLAFLLGSLVLRSSGPYFLMITLAFGQMIFALAWRWRSLTGGDDGLSGVPRPNLGLPISMWDSQNFYYLVLVFFVLSSVVLWRIVRSKLGRVIIGVRESESRMQALGYNTWLIKYLSYAIAGGFAGLAGVLFVYFNGFISPQQLDWSMSGLVILMVIIGGSGTLVGPVIGAGSIFILQNLISAQTERWPMSMGIIFILCVMYLRDGVVGHTIKLSKKGLKNYERFRNNER